MLIAITIIIITLIICVSFLVDGMLRSGDLMVSPYRMKQIELKIDTILVRTSDIEDFTKVIHCNTKKD